MSGDLNIGDVVKFRRPARGRIEVGQIRYVGHLPGKSDAFVGVELEHSSELSGDRPSRTIFVAKQFEQLNVLSVVVLETGVLVSRFPAGLGPKHVIT